MMATTHAFLGLVVTVLVLPVAGRHAPATAVLTAAFLGGLAPDLDLVTSHRKPLHFPVVLPVAAGTCFVAYGVLGGQSLFLLAVGLAAAGFHSVTDVLGGGIGYEPWRGTSSKAVYNHVLGRWHRPRRLVRYSGAPEDFALGGAVGVPVVLAPETGPAVDAVLIAVLVGSGVYAATRRRFGAVARSLRAVFPSWLVDAVPAVKFEDG